MTVGFKRFKTWLNGSTRRRLVFWSMAFWVISISLLSLIFLLVGQHQMLNEARQRNVQLASVISREINAQVGGMVDSTRVFKQHLEKIDPQLDVQALAILGLRLSSPQYRAVYYFDTNGNLLFQLTDPLANLIAIKNSDQLIALSKPPVNQQAANAFNESAGTTLFISGVSFAPLDYAPIMYIGTPISLSSGETRIGVFEFDLSDIWRRLELTTLGKTGITYAVSSKGVIISHPDPAYIGRKLPDNLMPVTNSYEGYSEYVDPLNHQQVLAAYSPVLGPTGWGIIVEQNLSEVYSTINQTGLLIAGIWIALGILGTVSIVLLTRGFTRPIKELTKTAQTIARTGNLTKTGMEQLSGEVGQLSQAFDQMIDRLRSSEGRLANAAAEERNRLARDLHDAVSQTLFSASLIAEVLPRLWERDQAEGRKRLEEVRQLTRGALAEMRTLLLELRPSSLIEAEIGHLLTQLGESITGRSRIPVTVAVEGQMQLPNEVKIALYRISQEALNNVAKHSGAKTARVSLVGVGESVTLTISDNGRGFDIDANSTKSLGLGIIRERAKEIGAALSIISRPDSGTVVSVTWNPPVDRDTRND